MPKILTNLDLGRNQLLNATIQNLAVEPSFPLVGQFYYNTTSGQPFYFDGVRWVPMNSSEAAQNIFANMTDGSNTAMADNPNGTFTFTSGQGISALVNASQDRLTITNTDRGSAQNIFKSISDGTNIASATQNSDTILFGQTGGATVTVDSVNKRVLIGHSDTSSVPNLTPVARTFISGLTFDTYGHVQTVSTGITHAQNTDTGTNSNIFQLGTNGINLKNDAGNNELQLRNSADTAFANIRVNDLIVEGTQTIINSNIVVIGDNEIELNGDITGSFENSDGGLAIKRFGVDNVTRMDAKITYNESLDRWTTTVGDITVGMHTAMLANKVTATVGDAVSNSFEILHNLATRDVTVSIRDNEAPYEQVMTDIEMTTINSVTVKFAVAPAAGKYNVVIIG